MDIKFLKNIILSLSSLKNSFQVLKTQLKTEVKSKGKY